MTNAHACSVLFQSRTALCDPVEQPQTPPSSTTPRRIGGYQTDRPHPSDQRNGCRPMAHREEFSLFGCSPVFETNLQTCGRGFG
jgi:hypothetical protein